MLHFVVFLGLATLACGKSGGSSSTPDDSGGEAGAGTGGATVTGGTGGSSSGGLSGTSNGGAGTGGASGGDGGSSAGKAGAGGGGQGDCGGKGGPDMVDVGDFCIDSTEVTYAQYQEFLDDPGAGSEQLAACAWNDSFEPAVALQNGESSDLPVRGVDWCDAYAFCQWSNKRLCGRPGGGPASYAEPALEEESQWFSACSGDGTTAFPYGDAYDAQACNGGDYGDAEVGPLPVGSIPTCVGGYPGIYDMSGNVWEWEDSCDASVGEADLCRARGGAFGNGADFHRCDYGGFSPARNFDAGPTGFRCCSL